MNKIFILTGINDLDKIYIIIYLYLSVRLCVTKFCHAMEHHQSSKEDQETMKVKKFLKNTSILIYEEIFLKNKKNKLSLRQHFFSICKLVKPSYNQFLEYF